MQGYLQLVRPINYSDYTVTSEDRYDEDIKNVQIEPVDIGLDPGVYTEGILPEGIQPN